MQQLEERNTYTPTDIPHVSGNCDPALNREETLSVSGLKTSSNNSDAAPIAIEHAKQNTSVSVVYVLNMRGKPLMPTSSGKARRLLKGGKARVVKRTPFTIQLNYATGENKQPITLGVDSGYLYVGLSAVTKKNECYSAQVNLRSDIVKLNSERRQYRRARRSRKTWYRPSRFLNRKKDDGWLAPSIQHKLDSHIKLIDNIKKILPVTKINIEVAAFDIQKIKNPNISGTEYQNGVQKDSWNVREYVLHRDNHTCQSCKGKSKDPVLETHHLVSRQVGGDSPDNLLTLCDTCHKKVSKGKLKLDIRIPAGFRPETFMTIVRWKLVNKLRELNNMVEHTYGYITKTNRITIGLPKSHINDAFVIAEGTTQKRVETPFLIKQVRKCNRKLFKGDRSHIKNTADRFIHGFQRFDKVLWKNIECFVFGRRKRGYFNLQRLDGTKVHTEASVKGIVLVESFNTFLIELIRRSTHLSVINNGVPATPAPHRGV